MSLSLQKVYDAIYNFEAHSSVWGRTRAKEILVGRLEYDQLQEDLAKKIYELPNLSNWANGKDLKIAGLPVHVLNKDTYFEVTGRK